MPRHPELPPAAAARTRARRRRHSDHNRIAAVDEQEADILARAYAAHLNTTRERDQ